MNSCTVPAVKQNRSSGTRSRIIAAARKLFLTKGFDNAAVAEICRAAEVSNGALFHQFATKEELGFAVYSEVRGEFWDTVMGAMVAAADPLDGIEAAVRAAFAFQQDNPGAAAFMFDVSGAPWLENFADQARALLDAVHARGYAWAEPHIAAGRLAPGPVDVFTALASGAPQWIGRMSRIGLTAASLDEIAEHMPRYVRRAFAPQ